MKVLRLELDEAKAIARRYTLHLALSDLGRKLTAFRAKVPLHWTSPSGLSRQVALWPKLLGTTVTVVLK
uniref:Uncharacterized protein n=1 Tax=Oryza punctata TaxID=4537 RepID=A0A0E0KZK8_ORYPU